MNTMTRREWLALAGSSMLATTWTRPSGAADIRSKAPFGPESIGSNTAIQGFGLFQAIDVLKKVGFATIEIHPFGQPEPRPEQIPGFEFDRLTEAERGRIKHALKGFRHITAHLPFIGLVAVSTDRQAQLKGRRAIETALDAVEYFGGELAVIHCLRPSGRSLDEAWTELVDLYRRWGERAQKGGFRLAVETGYPTSVARFVQFVQDIDHPNVGATIDVGHQIRYAEFRQRFPGAVPATAEAFRAYNDVIEMLIEQLGSKLFHFHVHDIDPAQWKDHRPIGFGVVDYPRLFRTLVARDYRGLFVLELGIAGQKMQAALEDNRKKLLHWIAEATSPAD